MKNLTSYRRVSIFGAEQKTNIDEVRVLDFIHVGNGEIRAIIVVIQSGQFMDCPLSELITSSDSWTTNLGLSETMD